MSEEHDDPPGRRRPVNAPAPAAGERTEPPPAMPAMRDRIDRNRAPDFITLDSSTAACLGRMIVLLEAAERGEPLDREEYDRLKREPWVARFFRQIDFDNLPKQR